MTPWLWERRDDPGLVGFIARQHAARRRRRVRKQLRKLRER